MESLRVAEELIVQCKSEHVISDDEATIRWTQDERLMETMRWVVIGFQLASDHDTACLEMILPENTVFRLYLIIIDSDNRLRVDSRYLMIDLFEWQTRKFIDNRLFSLKLSSFESHAALFCVHICQFTPV